jgi:hypothetical protein
MYANPAFQLKRTLEQFEARNITISDTITAAAELFQRVSTGAPAEPPVTAVRDAVLAGAEPEVIGAALLHQLGAHQLTAAWAQAATEAAHRALSAILAERADLHAQLKIQADEAIEKLGRLATIDVGLDTLIREGRTDDARLLADRDVIAGDLFALYELRDLALMPGTVRNARAGHIDATRWRNPDVVQHRISGSSAADGYISGIRGGGILWFPAAEEALEAAQPLYSMWLEAEEARRQRDASLGGYATFA